MSFDWNNLKIVLAASRAGSLARAAHLLDLDQSTTGRRLTALEADIGTSLFARTKTGLLPTETGKLIIERAEEVELRMQNLEDEIADGDGSVTGLIRLISSPWILEELTRVALADLLRKNPRLDIRLLGLIPTTPIRGEATLSFWFENQPRASEFAVNLGEVHYGLYAKKGLDPTELEWVSFFDEDAPRTAPVRLWEKMRGERGHRPRLTSTDARGVMIAVEAGVGKGVLPICLAEKSDLIVPFGKRPFELARTLKLHAHPDTVQANRTQAVMETLREQFAATFSRPNGDSRFPIQDE
ncbi:MAG: LysR family transcriptional regulator [Parasphingorhabdus sp.]|uniref:LysR family transcriptional regulator n=1 Tax=Parasphingorhabdus sp. TaxID=2709688 RepID=UPI003298C9CD